MSRLRWVNSDQKRSPTLNDWWKRVQADCFSSKLHKTEQRKPVEKDSKLVSLSLAVENGVLRHRSRLANATELPADVKQPVIHDAKHPYTQLVIMYFHVRSRHHGQERVCNESYRVGSVSFLRRKLGHAHDNSAESENVAGARTECACALHFSFRKRSGKSELIFYP